MRTAMTANPFAALLRDVPRYDGYWTFDPDGDVVRLSEVLAALAAALPARGVGEYTLAPHLQKIVDGAKAAPQWDIQADRLAPTDAAQAREAALLSDAANVIRDLMAAYSKPDERLCCNGHECGCQGATVQMQAEYYANEFLALIGEPRT